MSDEATSERARALSNGERFRERRRICGGCPYYVLRRCVWYEGSCREAQCFGKWLWEAESQCPKSKW